MVEAWSHGPPNPSPVAKLSLKNGLLGLLASFFFGLLLWSYLAPTPVAGSEIARGDVRLIQKRFQEAREHYQRAQALTPENFRVYQRLGRTHQGLGETGKAQEFFRQALTLSPNDLETQLLLGESLLRSGQGEEAEMVLRETLASNPGCLEALIQMGWARELQKDTEGSALWYGRATEIHPHYFEAEYQLGLIDLRAEQFEEALEHFQYTFGISPGWDELALEGSLLIYLKLNRPQEAESRLQDLKNKGGHPLPSLAKTHFNLGVYYAVHGDTARAREHLESSLRYQSEGEVAQRAREVLGKLSP